MKIIGIIGGCGSGKSEVSNLLKDNFNGYIINADKVGHDVLKNNEVYNKIINYFGKNILDENGNINRKRLGDIVFTNTDNLNKLTTITHPYIDNNIIDMINELKENNQYDYVILEITALGKGQIYSLINEYWYVYCNINIRLERLLKYRNISTKTAKNIISKQLTDSEFRKYADVVIDNSGTLNNTLEQIKRYLDN